VAELYAAGFGRPGIDPELAVRPMLAGFLLGIVHDRWLMREAQVSIAIRWFSGFRPHEALPFVVDPYPSALGCRAFPKSGR